MSSFSIATQPNRQALEARYNSLRSELSVIGKQLNELTQPSRLPPELLAEVFIRLNPFHPFPRSGNVRTARDLVVASHVCHYWREVTLQFPRLWSNIVLDGNPGFVEAALERSKSCGLNVRFTALGHAHFDPHYSPGFPLSREAHLCQLRKEMHRIRMLWHPEDLNRLEAETIRAHFPERVDAPQLLAYVEDVYRYQNIQVALVNTDPLRSTSLLSFLNAPNLRSLHLQMTLDVWKGVPSYQHLLHLTISDWTKMSVPTLMDILQCLRALPLLETLTLLRLLDMVESTGNKASLPSLTRIRLHGDLCPCASLLRHIEFPLTTCIVFEAYLPNLQDDLINSGVPDILYVTQRVAAGNTENPGILSTLQVAYVLEQHWSVVPCLRVWTEDPGNSSYFPYGAQWFGVEFCFLATTVLNPVTWEHPVFSVRYLRVSGLEYHQPSESLRSFRDLTTNPNVEELWFAESAEPSLTAFLAKQEGGLNVFPKLKTLHVEECLGVALCSRRIANFTGVPCDHCTLCKFLSDLLTLLRQRKDDGIPVENLTLESYPQVLTPEEDSSFRHVTSSIDNARQNSLWYYSSHEYTPPIEL